MTIFVISKSLKAALKYENRRLIHMIYDEARDGMHRFFIFSFKVFFLNLFWFSSVFAVVPNYSLEDTHETVMGLTQTLLRAAPIEEYVYVGLGRSPTLIMYYLEYIGADVIHLPISGLGYFLNDSTAGRSDIDGHEQKFIERYLSYIQSSDKKVVLIDVVGTGQSLRRSLTWSLRAQRQMGNRELAFFGFHHDSSRIEEDLRERIESELSFYYNIYLRGTDPFFRMVDHEQYNDMAKYGYSPLSLSQDQIRVMRKEMPIGVRWFLEGKDTQLRQLLMNHERGDATLSSSRCSDITN